MRTARTERRKTLTMTEFCRLWGVGINQGPKVLRQLVAEGKLTALQTGRKGRWLIPAAPVYRILGIDDDDPAA